jgi:two-component system, NarL family, sensor histidine kinase DesK
VARLVRAFEELHATRIELAQSAVGNEQLRLSRDLHDLLGQSLTAVSLKGDLALALLPTDRRAAEAEIRELTAIARDALRGSRTVTRGERTVSLRAEVDRAAPTAAGVAVTKQLRHALRISATRRNGDATNVAPGYLLTGAGLEKLA